MKKLYIGLIIPFCLYSQDLSELIDISTKNSLVQSSSLNVQSLQSKYESTKSSYLPKLTVGATYSTTNEETMTTPSDATITFANINYVVYDGGTKNSIYKSFDANIKSANESLNSLKNNISLQVVTYYFNYLTLISAKEAKLKEIETLNAQLIRLKRFLDAGTTTSDEVDKIISRVENAKVISHEIELNIQTILHNLEYITSQKVAIDSGSSILEFKTIDETLRADIKAIEHSIDALREDARASKGSNYPRINLDNTYTYYDMNYDNQTYQNSAIDSQNIFKVNLTWKLYDFGTTSKNYDSLQKQYLALKSKYEYEKNKASVDLKLALKSYEIAKLKIISAQAALNAANSTYDTIEQKYQNGLVENIAYLEALSEKFNALSGFKMANYDLEIKKAKIIYHSGKNIWEYIK